MISSSALMPLTFKSMSLALITPVRVSPIRIRLRGSYHELARFVSDIAALPRIVTIHDIELSGSEGDAELQMDLIAKTYRYLEDDEEQS